MNAVEPQCEAVSYEWFEGQRPSDFRWCSLAFSLDVVAPAAPACSEKTAKAR